MTQTQTGQVQALAPLAETIRTAHKAIGAAMRNALRMVIRCRRRTHRGPEPGASRPVGTMASRQLLR
jgi:hypothetical protein